MPDIRVAWYNLENLFDHATADRHPDLARTLRRELRGWTVAVRDRKLDQLARVVRAMFGGAGPDLLGVCEVENERVLGMLADRMAMPGRNYRVIGHDSRDTRGIDVSFIMDANLLEAENTGHQTVVKRTATRDIFWVDLIVRATGGVFVAAANHWPSRTAGQYESEPFRLLTGETLSVVVDELMHGFDIGTNIPILLMGDFNDEPFNRSMQEYLLGARDRGRVSRARSPRVLNLMWPLMSVRNPGTHRFGSDWNMLDQFLVTRGMLRTQSLVRVLPESVEIFRPEFVRGSGGAPRRFGRPSRGMDRDGFSDHFPIAVTLRAN